MKFHNWLILIPLILPGCMRVSVTREFNELECRTKKDVAQNIYWQNCAQKSSPEHIRTNMQNGLSRDQAVGIALANNPNLLAEFETLGIAKADVVQAGLFQNPQVTAIFRDPRTVGLRNNTEVEATIALTDFWQVPLQKRVANDQLEITSLSIFESILKTIQETTTAYNHTIFAHHQEQLAKKIVGETKQLRDSIYHRQNYGFTTDLDTNLADVLVGHAHVMLTDAINQRSNAVLTLQELLGIRPENNQPTLFTDSLDDIFAMPDQDALVCYALGNHPEVQMARFKVQQYEHLITLEKARTIQTLDFGVGLERPSECNILTKIGPMFNIGVPIFDYNQAQRARAHYLCDQATKQLEAVKLHITQTIRSTYSTVTTYKKQVRIYQDQMMPAGERAISYTLDFNKKMQITMPTIFQTYLSLLNVRQNYIKAQQLYLNSYAELERFVSKKLSEF